MRTFMVQYKLASCSWGAAATAEATTMTDKCCAAAEPPGPHRPTSALYPAGFRMLGRRDADFALLRSPWTGCAVPADLGTGPREGRAQSRFVALRPGVPRSSLANRLKLVSQRSLFVAHSTHGEEPSRLAGSQGRDQQTRAFLVLSVDRRYGYGEIQRSAPKRTQARRAGEHRICFIAQPTHPCSNGDLA